MNNLWWQTVGTGNRQLVLLHGWGLNAEIWRYIQEKLISQFTLHLVDLPGFGRSQGYGSMSLDEMVQCITDYAPKKAIWLGWSLGGLIASQVALIYPERVQALVNVASSPCFVARKKWPGIKPDLLTCFQQQLKDDFYSTVEHFLALQITGNIGNKTLWNKIHILKQVVFAVPLPSLEILNSGLEIIKNVDLREELTMIRIPHLRIYGHLDNLVPNKIVPLLDSLWPYSRSLTIFRAAHAPFISHPEKFCDILTALSRCLD